jgi:hypothetical protein
MVLWAGDIHHSHHLLCPKQQFIDTEAFTANMKLSLAVAALLPLLTSAHTIAQRVRYTPPTLSLPLLSTDLSPA